MARQAAWNEPIRRKARRRIEPEAFAEALEAFKANVVGQRVGQQKTNGQTNASTPFAPNVMRVEPPTSPMAASSLTHTEPSEPSPQTAQCAACQGIGWLHLDVAVGHPQFGQLIRCACQATADKAARSERAARASNLTAELRHVRFADIIPQDDEVAAAKAELETFASDPHGWIILSGAWGTNKTRLMAACANALLDGGQRFPLYVVVPDFLDYVRSAYDVEQGVVSESANERIEQAINADVLMLDDLGAQSATPWADEKLFRIINARYNAGAPLVVTTNLNTKTIEPRIRSRLFDVRLTGMREYTFGGPDQRQQLNAKGGR